MRANPTEDAPRRVLPPTSLLTGQARRDVLILGQPLSCVGMGGHGHGVCRHVPVRPVHVHPATKRSGLFSGPSKAREDRLLATISHAIPIRSRSDPDQNGRKRIFASLHAPSCGQSGSRPLPGIVDQLIDDLPGVIRARNSSSASDSCAPVRPASRSSFSLWFAMIDPDLALSVAQCRLGP